MVSAPAAQNRTSEASGRDHQADAIRQALYLAGCRPHRDKDGGRTRPGYRIEATGTDPALLVRHVGDTGEHRERAEHAYQTALAAAGYVVEPITGEGGLRLWPLGQRPPLPAIDPRDLLNAWIRGLTLFGEKGRSLEETLALITQVNGTGTHRVAIRTPLPADDIQSLHEVQA